MTYFGAIALYWRKEDIEKLRDLIECNIDQIDILRTFPQYTWRQLQQRYAYHFNDNLWLKSYSGEVINTRHKKWSDTDEYSAQLTTDRVLSEKRYRYR